jgi:uncharacterized protein (TIGR01777 family)
VTVVLAGASGQIGRALATSLQADGIAVRRLVRRPPSGPDEVRWDPADRFLEPDVITESDAVVCLSGAPVDAHRWTDAYKQTLIDSRIDSVGTIAKTLAEAGDAAPQTLIVASAVGYYGDTGDRVVTEDAPPGDGFLSDVCVQWEAAATPARDAGIRVAHLRTGLVLGDGGLLGRLKPVVQLGVAGRIGSGRQFMPWITLHDHVRAIRFLLAGDLGGPVNLTGPEPARNAEFMSTLGRVLKRPTVLPTPSFALKVVLGELADDVLTGQRALPAALSAAGFEFEHSDLETGLRWALDR